ncbi:MAG: PEP-CTERM sorting domain-containing protein [Phycisphaerae bacterium]|nr:PEP-CTERM sorting domain-containing protein [Phycisphaerae bacterium]
MRISAVCAAAAMMAAGSAMAQPYVVRGEFNGWGAGGDIPMVENPGGSGRWTGLVTGLTPGQLYEFKATTPDWSFNAPGSNARTAANSFGELVVHFFPNTSWSDGWMPNNIQRLGYDDPGQFGWDLMGSVNGWSSPFGALSLLGGVHTVQVAMPAGTHQFKFRKAGDWAVSIGGDFGNSAGNASVTTSGVNPVQFDLDLANGRWRAFEVPAPGALALLGLGALAAARRRRA